MHHVTLVITIGNLFPSFVSFSQMCCILCVFGKEVDEPAVKVLKNPEFFEALEGFNLSGHLMIVLSFLCSIYIPLVDTTNPEYSTVVWW